MLVKKIVLEKVLSKGDGKNIQGLVYHLFGAVLANFFFAAESPSDAQGLESAVVGRLHIHAAVANVQHLFW